MKMAAESSGNTNQCVYIYECSVIFLQATSNYTSQFIFIVVLRICDTIVRLGGL